MVRLYKSCVLTLCAVIITIGVHAQDEIYKVVGGVIDAKVLSVGINTVTFKRYDDPQGPEHTLQKRAIIRIVYQNGTTDVFNDDVELRRPPVPRFPGFHFHDPVKDTGEHSGKNIISLVPAFTSSPGDNSINDAGIGLGYERALDTWGHFSFDLRAMIFFSSNKDFTNYNYYPYGNTGSANVTYSTYKSYYLMPGVKFYPSADNKKIRYALGASFFCIIGTEPYAVYENSGYSSSSAAPSGNYNYAVYGFMITNSLNVAATQHSFLAFDLSLAAPVSDNRHEGMTIDFYLPNPIIQIGLRVGYRY